MLVYSSLLKNEILGTTIEDFKEAAALAGSPGGVGGINGGPANGNGLSSDNSNINQGNSLGVGGVGNGDRRNGAVATGLPGSGSVYPSPGGGICGSGGGGIHNNR